MEQSLRRCPFRKLTCKKCTLFRAKHAYYGDDDNSQAYLRLLGKIEPRKRPQAD